MKFLSQFALTLIFLCFVSGVAQAQKRRPDPPARAQAVRTEEATPAPTFHNGDSIQTTICKGQPTPDGYVTAGETRTGDCPQGAWILKKRGSRLRPDAPQPSYTIPAQQTSSADNEDDEEGASPRKNVMSERTQAASQEAVRALRRMSNATSVGLTLDEYKVELLSLKGTLDEVMPRIPAGGVREQVSAALSEYYYAAEMWSLMRRNGFDWISAEGNGPGNELMTKYQIKPIRGSDGVRRLTKQLVMGAIWRKALEHMRSALSSLN
jgi:hypothetical protein